MPVSSVFEWQTPRKRQGSPRTIHVRQLIEPGRLSFIYLSSHWLSFGSQCSLISNELSDLTYATISDCLLLFFFHLSLTKINFHISNEILFANAFACGIHFTFALNFVIISHTHSTLLFSQNVCILLLNHCKASVWALKYIEVYFILWEWKKNGEKFTKLKSQ